jgi:hypothetical protein
MAPAVRLLADASDQLHRRQLTGGAGADRQVVDLAQVRLRFEEAFLFVRRDQYRSQLQCRGAVGETGDGGAPKGADGFLVSRTVDETAALGFGGQGLGAAAGPYAIAIRSPSAAITSGFEPRSALRIEKPLALPEIAVTPEVPVARSSRPTLETVLVAPWSPSSPAPRRRRRCFRWCRWRRHRGRQPRRRSFRGRCRLP